MGKAAHRSRRFGQRGGQDDVDTFKGRRHFPAIGMDLVHSIQIVRAGNPLRIIQRTARHTFDVALLQVAALGAQAGPDPRGGAAGHNPGPGPHHALVIRPRAPGCDCVAKVCEGVGGMHDRRLAGRMDGRARKRRVADRDPQAVRRSRDGVQITHLHRRCGIGRARIRARAGIHHCRIVTHGSRQEPVDGHPGPAFARHRPVGKPRARGLETEQATA